MKRILFALLVLTSFSAFAQNDTLVIADLDKLLVPINLQLKSLSNSKIELEKRISILDSRLQTANESIISMKQDIQSNQDSLDQRAEKLGLQISTTGKESNSKIEAVDEASKKRISEVDESLSRSTLYGIIGVLLAILCSGLIYWMLSKRQQTDKTDLIAQLSKTKSSIEESLVQEFGKQTELMYAQLQLIAKQASEVKQVSDVEPDHSLPLKLASEINLIERNISLMDSGTKGLKHLSKSVGKLKDNLAANGYEMPELLGKPFNQGMKLIVVSTVPDEKLKSDEEIITKVLIPQVNFKDAMIQAAQIETSKG
jgi:hypothetical protein